MKKTKLILLISALSVLTICGCKSNSQNSEKSSSIESTTSIESSVSSSLESSTSSSFSSSSQATEDNTLVINLLNPSCGSMSTEVLNDRLAIYINGLVTTPIISSITNSKCQITNDIPNKGDKVLEIGSGSSTGSLELNFTTSIKMMTVSAQTYYKPYVDTWSGDEPITYPNVDTDSVLNISGAVSPSVATVDLKSTNDQPVEKDFSLAVNSNKLTFSTANAEKGRVFIKSITLVY